MAWLVSENAFQGCPPLCTRRLTWAITVFIGELGCKSQTQKTRVWQLNPLFIGNFRGFFYIFFLCHSVYWAFALAYVWVSVLFICSLESCVWQLSWGIRLFPSYAFTNLGRVVKILECCKFSSYTMTCNFMTFLPGATCLALDVMSHVSFSNV